MRLKQSFCSDFEWCKRFDVGKKLIIEALKIKQENIFFILIAKIR